MTDKILIVVDTQNDFIDGSLGTAEAQVAVPSIVNKIKQFKGKIFATRDTHQEDYLETMEGKALPVPHCKENAEGWQIHPDIEKAMFENKGYLMIINKPTFGSKQLVEELKKLPYIDKCKEIVLIGFCTDICVMANALLLKTEFYEDKIITVDSTCCAGVTPEKHEAALEALRSCQINVI